MGNDKLPAPTTPERDFWGEVEADYASSNVLGRIAFWVVTVGGMALVYAILGTLIYGSPLGPLRAKAPQPSPAVASEL